MKTKYKHTQIGYLMIIILSIVFVLFAWVQIASRMEPESIDSGANFLFTAIMVLVLLTLVSFISLQVAIDEKYLKIKFGYGIFRKKFLLSDIVFAQSVKNSWWYGWGIRRWFFPNMWIFNVSGFDAVEIKLKNGKIYRIGTDEPEKLKKAIYSSSNAKSSL